MGTRHIDLADLNTRNGRRHWRRHLGAGLVLIGALAACGDDAADEPGDASDTSAIDSTTARSSTSDPTRATRPTPDVQGDETVVTAASGGETSDVAAAQDGLGRYLSEHRPPTAQTSTNIDGCPAIDLDVLHAAMSAVGLDDALEDWGTEIEWSEYRDLDPDLMGIACSGDSDGDSHGSDVGTAVSVGAVDLAGMATFDELVDEFGLERTAVGADGSGWEAAGDCYQDGGAAACVELRHRDGPVIGVFVESVDYHVDAGVAEALLTGILPDVMNTLAAE